MTNIDTSIKFISINIGLITISDTRTAEDDKSGNLLKKRIENFGHKVLKKIIVKDSIQKIKENLDILSNDSSIDAIITTGGTGLTGRDSTPEAIIQLSEKIIDGFGELFRQISYKKIGTSTVQSRAIAAIINHKYVFALPIQVPIFLITIGKSLGPIITMDKTTIISISNHPICGIANYFFSEF